jgi:hypothetical protein
MMDSRIAGEFADMATLVVVYQVLPSGDCSIANVPATLDEANPRNLEKPFVSTELPV